MAPSAAMASTVSSNSDLKCHSTFFSLAIAALPGNPSDTFGPASMDDLLKNLYSDANRSQHETSFHATDGCRGIDAAPAPAPASLPSFSQQRSPPLPKNVASKSADEVWKDIVSGNDQRRSAAVGESMEEMTLEDFLAKAGAVREEEVRAPVVSGQGNYNGDSMFHPQSVVEGVSLAAGFVNEVDGRGMGGGRGKRRALEEPMDKVTQQKQRRMIKNRESAARSRERKQAYTVELESLVSQLEEENARLIREETEQSKERFKQLMKSLVPVTEDRRPPRCIRRVNSVQW